jgi:hypothetical protein
VPESIHARALRQAAKVLGGYENLQRRLQVPASSLLPWLNGAEPMPERVFLQVVDIIAGNPEDSTGIILPPDPGDSSQDTPKPS